MPEIPTNVAVKPVIQLTVMLALSPLLLNDITISITVLTTIDHNGLVVGWS